MPDSEEVETGRLRLLDQPGEGGSAVAVLARHRDRDRIVNSRNTANEDVVRNLASMACSCLPWMSR